MQRSTTGTQKQKAANVDYKVSLIMIGDSSVGKTCFLLKFADENSNVSHIPTIGIDFKIKTVQIDGKTVKLQVWDTAGQERYRTITQTYFRDVQGVIIVYDCTSEESFNNVRNWVRQVEAHTSDREKVESVLIGNKVDLADRKVIDSEDGKALAKEFGMTFFEASARTGLNVQETFLHLTKKIKDKLSSKDVADLKGGQDSHNEERQPSVRESIILKRDTTASENKK